MAARRITLGVPRAGVIVDLHLAVVAGNVWALLGLGGTAVLLTVGQSLLNLAGYALAGLCFPWIRERAKRVALLFTVSRKEFSIAAAFAATSQLPDVLAIPAVFCAVVQMITSPLAVRLLQVMWPLVEHDSCQASGNGE